MPENVEKILPLFTGEWREAISKDLLHSVIKLLVRRGEVTAAASLLHRDFQVSEANKK